MEETLLKVYRVAMGIIACVVIVLVCTVVII
jgi:hypothetical protein